MKSIFLAATLAALSLSFSAPLQAASVSPTVSLAQLEGSIDRHGHRCDTPRDIAEHPRCTQP